MRFKEHVTVEQQDYLTQLYKRYIKETPMTKSERKQLREWVADGNSPYENGYNAVYDGNMPVDFITSIRIIEEEQRWFESLSEEEKEELRNPVPSDIVDLGLPFDTYI